jgi:hypothetical protein
MIDKNQAENVKHFKHWGSMITNDARCTRELKPRLAWQKQH